MPCRILIVDDSELFRRTAAQLLAKRGFEPAAAVADGEAALAAVSADCPDGILLDSRPRKDTPGGDGGTRPDGPDDGTGPAGPGGRTGDAGDGGPGPGGPGSPDEPAGCPDPGPPAGVVPAGFAGRVTLTVPLATLLDLADRPGELAGLGPIDPWLARDLAGAAARNLSTTWCLTVTDQHGHAVGHDCARPEPKNRQKQHGPGPPGGNRDGPGFTFTTASRDSPPGGYSTWRLRTPGSGPDLTITLDPLTTDPCDHRHEARGHDPGIRLRHLSGIRHTACTSPICRRPAATCDYEHNTPYEAGGRTCLCNGGPECKR